MLSPTNQKNMHLKKVNYVKVKIVRNVENIDGNKIFWTVIFHFKPI